MMFVTKWIFILKSSRPHLTKCEPSSRTTSTGQLRTYRSDICTARRRTSSWMQQTPEIVKLDFKMWVSYTSVHMVQFSAYHVYETSWLQLAVILLYFAGEFQRIPLHKCIYRSTILHIIVRCCFSVRGLGFNPWQLHICQRPGQAGLPLWTWDYNS